MSGGKTTDVLIGFLTSGTGAPAPAIAISWHSQEEMAEDWEMLRLCDVWRLRATYGSEVSVRLTATSDKPIFTWIPVHVMHGTVETSLLPVYTAWWTVKSEEATRMFMLLARVHGYFALMGAVNDQISTEPLICHLR